MPRPLADEPELYPPDVEHVTPEAREQRIQAIVGTTLVVLGLGFILERLVRLDGNDNLDFYVLAVGLGLLAGWARVPRYPMYVFGALLTGYGSRSFFESLVDVRFETAIGSLLAAAGFFAIYVRYPRRSWWAIVGAGLFVVGAVLDFGIGIIGWVSASVDLMPLALVSGGTLLLLRDRLPSWFVKTGLVFAGVVFLLAATTNIGDGDSGDRAPKATTTTEATGTTSTSTSDSESTSTVSSATTAEPG